MSDFPVADVSDAISKLISNVLPPRTYELLFALLPGIFFEISILLGNPALICDLVARAQDGFGLGHYAMLGLALVLAFIIGNAFMLLVILIQRLLGYLYRLRAFLWDQLFQKRPLGQPPDEDARKCWALLARRLLQDQYGIELEDIGQDEWNVLYLTLVTPTMMDVRGNILMIASEAMGWCGLTATLFAHALWNRYYVAFSVLLIAAGLLHDWHMAGNLNNPRFLGFLKIRALLREYRKTPKPHRKDGVPD